MTEYLLLDFWEASFLGACPRITLVAFGEVLDLHPFVVQPLGTVRGNTIAPGDIEPGKTLWTVAGSKIDPQILNDLVEAAERLSGPPTGEKTGGSGGRGRARMVQAGWVQGSQDGSRHSSQHP